MPQTASDVAREQTAGSPPQADRRRVARLFNRAAFGATVQEIDQWAQLGYATAVDHLVGFAPASGRADDVEVTAVATAAGQVDGLGSNVADPLSPFQGWWLRRMATTAYPLEEKLTLYWHGHFATGFSKVARVQAMVVQNRLFRDYAAGDFRQLSKRITGDGAMLVWLDGATNRAGATNENYGREFFELFTVGRDQGYGQSDVREASRAFTGYTVDGEGGARFVAALHDRSDKTILGHRGPWGPADVTDLVLDRHPRGPAAANYVAHRLASFLHRPDPEPALVDAMARRFVSGGYATGPMVRTLLTRPEFMNATHLTVKSPAELVAGVIRALGFARGAEATADPMSFISSLATDEFARACGEMGQVLFDPPSVAGWRGGASWANTATSISRYNFAARVGELVAEDLVTAALDEADGIPETVARTWMDRLGLLELSPATNAGITQYVAAARAAGDAPHAIARGLLTLLVASPDYNLR